MSLFDIADKVIAEAYPGKPGWWGAKRIPNYGILRGAIVAALEVERRATSGNSDYAAALTSLNMALIKLRDEAHKLGLQREFISSTYVDAVLTDYLSALPSGGSATAKKTEGAK